MLDLVPIETPADVLVVDLAFSARVLLLVGVACALAFYLVPEIHILTGRVVPSRATAMLRAVPFLSPTGIPFGDLALTARVTFHEALAEVLAFAFVRCRRSTGKQ